jgi:protein involved in polysaccharide export with SLBB domain
MTKRVLLAGLTLLCLTVSVLAQTPIKLDLFKLSPLHSGDWLFITIYELDGVAVYSGASVLIRDDGSIDVPSLGKAQAAGLTVVRLREVLQTQFDAVVTVTFMKDPPRWASVLRK